jgi:hypothetical protein
MHCAHQDAGSQGEGEDCLAPVVVTAAVFLANI